jgi:hypothetical protein
VLGAIETLASSLRKGRRRKHLGPPRQERPDWRHLLHPAREPATVVPEIMSGAEFGRVKPNEYGSKIAGT